MKKNIKTMGLVALLVGSLLMLFVIPALAECPPPWMMCDEGGAGTNGGRDPRNPWIDCYYPRVTAPAEGEISMETYYPSCLYCGEYKYGTPLSYGICSPYEKQDHPRRNPL